MKIMIKCEQKRVFSFQQLIVCTCVCHCVWFSQWIPGNWLSRFSFFFIFSPPLSFRGCPHCFIPHHNSTVLGVATGIPTLNGHTKTHVLLCLGAILLPVVSVFLHCFSGHLYVVNSRWPTCHPERKISCNYSARHLPAEDVKNMWTYCSFFYTTSSNVNQPRLVHQLGKHCGINVWTLHCYRECLYSHYLVIIMCIHISFIKNL